MDFVFYLWKYESFDGKFYWLNVPSIVPLRFTNIQISSPRVITWNFELALANNGAVDKVKVYFWVWIRIILTTLAATNASTVSSVFGNHLPVVNLGKFFLVPLFSFSIDPAQNICDSSTEHSPVCQIFPKETRWSPHPIITELKIPRTSFYWWHAWEVWGCSWVVFTISTIASFASLMCHSPLPLLF